MDYKLIFETERLVVRQFKTSDKIAFFDMMGNPTVMNPIAQSVFTKKESNEKLLKLISFYKLNSEKKIWAINIKNNFELIGLCGLIVNNENDNEIAYRLREKFMVFDKEFYNKKDNCIDRRYKLSKENWSKKLS